MTTDTPIEAPSGAPGAGDPPTFDTTLDRIVDSRQRNSALQQPFRRDIERPDGPPQGEVWRAVMRGEVPSVAFLERFVGYRPLAYVRMPRGDLYFLNDPELIWEVFVNADVVKGFGLQMARAVVGDGILTSEGDKHRTHRTMVQPAFTGRQIAGYGHDMLAAVRDADERWSQQYDAGDSQIMLLDDMTRLTLDIVGRTLFGMDLAEVSDEIGPDLAAALSVFGVTVNPKWMVLSRYPSRPRRQLTGSVDRMDAVVAGMIRDKRAEVAAGVAGADMMSTLIRATDPETGMGLTDNEVRDEAMTLLLAGHETTTMLLTWTWLFLFQHPEWKDWAAQEWDATDELSIAGLTKMPRTRAVLAESLRLRPPAWVVDRIATQDTVVGDYVVPMGESFLASQYTMHRDERYWPEPLRFRPDRWIDDSGDFTEKIVPRGVYFPFGFAARKCIGDRFALAEAALALAHLGRRWHVIPLDPSGITPDPSVTLRPSTNVPAVLRRR